MSAMTQEEFTRKYGTQFKTRGQDITKSPGFNKLPTEASIRANNRRQEEIRGRLQERQRTRKRAAASAVEGTQIGSQGRRRSPAASSVQGGGGLLSTPNTMPSLLGDM